MRLSFYSGRNPLALPMQEESAPLLRILHFSGEAEATGKGWSGEEKCVYKLQLESDNKVYGN